MEKHRQEDWQPKKVLPKDDWFITKRLYYHKAHHLQVKQKKVHLKAGKKDSTRRVGLSYFPWLHIWSQLHVSCLGRETSKVSSRAETPTWIHMELAKGKSSCSPYGMDKFNNICNWEWGNCMFVWILPHHHGTRRSYFLLLVPSYQLSVDIKKEYGKNIKFIILVLI